MGRIFTDIVVGRVTIVSLMALFGCLPVAGHAQAQAGTGVTVDLQVIDGDSGQPVENVVVRIPESDTYLLTDSLGQASLVDIEVGSYRLILTRMGYEAQRGEFTVDRSGSFRIALTPVLLSSEAEPGEVIGRVIDPETGDGIESAEVTVAGTLRRATDERGWFTIELVPAGSHPIEVAYLGRETVVDSIFVPDGQTLEVEIPMPVEAIELEGITVTTHARFLSRAGFFRRQRQAPALRGQQWTAEELADRDPMYLQDVVTEIPSIIRPIPAAGEGSNGRLSVIGAGTDKDTGEVLENRCPLKIFVDDFPMDDWFDLDHVDPRRVAALEVYFTGRRELVNNLPPAYRGLLTQGYCGVVLVWLKRR
jgi:hypothetical protein